MTTALSKLSGLLILPLFLFTSDSCVSQKDSLVYKDGSNIYVRSYKQRFSRTRNLYIDIGPDANTPSRTGVRSSKGISLRYFQPDGYTWTFDAGPGGFGLTGGKYMLTSTKFKKKKVIVARKVVGKVYQPGQPPMTIFDTYKHKVTMQRYFGFAPKLTYGFGTTGSLLFKDPDKLWYHIFGIGAILTRGQAIKFRSDGDLGRYDKNAFYTLNLMFDYLLAVGPKNDEGSARSFSIAGPRFILRSTGSVRKRQNGGFLAIGGRTMAKYGRVLFACWNRSCNLHQV